MVVGVYFGVKNKSVPKENGLVESSSTNTLNIDTSNLVKEELYSEGQGKKIYGYITAPKNYKDQKLPTVIISHGFGGLAERGDFYAQSLAKAGYVVYSFDFMGGNKNSRSGNDTLNMSVFTEVDDLDVVISKLKSQSYVDQSKIFLLGQSQGGVVSTIEAAKLKGDIKGLILVFPAFVLFDDARELFKSTSPETFISEPRVEINLESAEATYPPLTKVFPLLTTVPPLLISFSNLVLLVANVPFLPTFTFEVYDFPFITTAPSFNVVFPLNVLAPFNTNVPAPFFTSPTSPVISLSKL